MASISRSKSFNCSPSSVSNSVFCRSKYSPQMPSPFPTCSLSRSFSRSTKFNYLGQNWGPSSHGTTHSTSSSSSSSTNSSSGHGHIHGPQGTPLKINPNKTTRTIQGLQIGLKGAISLMQEQLERNNQDIQGQQSQGRIYELEKSSKAATLRLKTLEYQLSRLESLEEEYILQQKLREGVRHMGAAYALSPAGHHQKLALANVRAGFRECTETLGSLESQLQQFLGSFTLTMKGIQGFARLTPGDVYEITLRHGAQKWKSRTRVGKDGGQENDAPGAKMKALLGTDLTIKASELKTLGKNVLLGDKACEICELFCAHPQLMMVNLNPSGSLKLNIIIEWDPLSQFYSSDSTPATVAESPVRKRRMIISPSVLKQNRATVLGPTAATTKLGGDSTTLITTLTKKKAKGRAPSPPTTSSLSVSKTEELKENLAKLASILNDELQGAFPELEVAEVNIAALRRAAFQEYPLHHPYTQPYGWGLGLGNRRTASSSCSSLNIESALEAFDFLDACDVSSPPPLKKQQHQSTMGLFPLEEEPMVNDPPKKQQLKTPRKSLLSGTGTTDSGISSLNSSSRSPSPGNSASSTFVTGSEQLDMSLSSHVSICLSLVTQLGAFGPLKSKERRALGKLQQQGIILGSILSRMSSSCAGDELLSPYVTNLWSSITQSSVVLVTSADAVAYGLEKEIRNLNLLDFSSVSGRSVKLAQALVLQILDGDEDLEGEEDGEKFGGKRRLPLSLFQFNLFLKPYANSNAFGRLVAELHEEELLVEKLGDGKLSEVLAQLGTIVVPSRKLFLLLVRQIHKKQIQEYFLALANTRRREILEYCLDLLESSLPFHRLCVLSLLSALQGFELLEQVAYLAQTDDDAQVLDASKAFLLSKKGGGKMHAQLTLNSHGFQGLLSN